MPNYVASRSWETKTVFAIRLQELHLDDGVPDAVPAVASLSEIPHQSQRSPLE